MSSSQRVHLWCRTLSGDPTARLAYARVLADEGRHEAAFHQFARAAGHCADWPGLAAAQSRLGRCYLLGLGVPSCVNAALHWLRCGAEGGDAEAQTMLASLALQGIGAAGDTGLFDATSTVGRAPDYQLAMRWGVPAAAAGSAEAQALLGYIMTTGPDDLRDPLRGARYYQQSAANGFAQGQLGWALALLRGDNSPRDDPDGRSARAEAQACLELAAAAGLPAAHFALGVLADIAATDADQLAVAAAHYRAGAELGHRSAQVRYGMALRNGRGVPRNAQDGESWLRRAGLAGDVLAAALVGDLYAHQGDELPPNLCEAALWFQRAAEAGHIGAARALGQLCLHGGGFGSDPATAVHWLRVAATADDPVAAYELGICLANGIGTPHDDVEALQWFRHAIDALPAALYWYGRMLAEGRGCAPDQAAARTCYLRAAEGGNGDAAVAAGEMLVNGRGGKQDREAAMRLFTKAAAEGHQGARYALRVLTAEATAANA